MQKVVPGKITNYKLQITKPRQAGVTLLLAILVLSSILAISFSLATILFIEVRNSGDLIKTEPAFYAANGVGEQAIFNVKRKTCTNGSNCNYATSFDNNVTMAPPHQTSTSSPIFQDKIPPNSSFSSAKVYQFYNAALGPGSTAGSGYGKISLTYLDTGGISPAPLQVYICEFDPTEGVNSAGASNTYNSTACSDPNDTIAGSGDGTNDSYWPYYTPGGISIYPNTPINSSTWTLNPNKQQELILFNPGTQNNIFVSVETFGPSPDYAAMGLPYGSETAVEINASNGSVGRRVRVVVPNTSGISGGSATGFAHHRQIAVNSGQVSGGGPLASFPVLVNWTDSTLKSAGNGGNVQSSGGTDIVFTSDAAGNSVIPYEQEKYDPATGQIVYWVDVASLTNSSVFYMFYDKAGASDQSNPSGVWDSSYKGVWHLPNGSTLTANDSTGNTNNGTVNGATATTGNIDGGGNFSGSSQAIDMASNVGGYVLTDSFTVSAWINPALNSANEIIYGNIAFSTGYHLRVTTANKIRFILVDGGGSLYSARDSGTLSAGWHDVVGVWKGSGIPDVYVDGVLDNNAIISNGSLTSITTSAITRIGAVTDGGGFFFNGKIDEVRTSKTARSADWIATEYNNQSAPASFYTVGTEQ